MKTVYKTPVAEVVSFTALEDLATLRIRLDNFGDDNFTPDVTSRTEF